MWYNRPFSQRNKTTKRAVGVGWTKFAKGEGGRQYKEVFI